MISSIIFKGDDSLRPAELIEHDRHPWAWGKTAEEIDCAAWSQEQTGRD
jgi:hypothetical protein